MALSAMALGRIDMARGRGRIRAGASTGRLYDSRVVLSKIYLKKKITGRHRPGGSNGEKRTH